MVDPDATLGEVQLPGLTLLGSEDRAAAIAAGRVVAGIRNLGKMVYDFNFRRVARKGFGLYHEPNFLPIDCNLPTVTTIHDLSVLLHPEWHPADRVAEHTRDFVRGVARSQHIITVSDHARSEIIHHLGLPADRVSRPLRHPRWPWTDAT